MTRPRVVHVTTTDISLELLLGPQLRAFVAAGYDVVGVSAPGPYAERLEQSGIRHVALANATRSMALRRDVAALFELRDIFRSLTPDIVHTHNPKPGVYGRIAARLAGVPAVVNTVHGLYALPGDPLAKRLAVYGLERVASTCSRAELIQNVEDVAVLRRIGVPARKLHLLGNGIDLGRFDPARFAPGHRDALRSKLGIPAGAVVCGVVGRLVWEKGYREVFDAAVRLARSRPDAHFVVIGPSDTAKADAIPESVLADVAARANVHLLGERDDVDEWYAAFDLYVLGSYREGFPRSAMEAAAMGLPVVATAIRGCRQVVDDGRTGLLVPVRDAAALAGAIERLVDDPAQRARMGAAARVKALEEFDQQRCVDLTLAVYDRLTGHRRVGAAA